MITFCDALHETKHYKLKKILLRVHSVDWKSSLKEQKFFLSLFS